ncbi:serine/threonine-protein kinase RIO3 [Episyrphus balteatus]|uniref:serine/threonine-protein kinase RIO3 n=1 Tax=Episyrphus balteatus TaxID=286459 RepID=UPI002485C270|nr:serine/threonine-protein kinase RIO3 [Episyrphus balteatus]
MSSPWGKVENVQSMNFAEIMSEEYAREMHNKEIKKNEQLLLDRLKNATKIKEKELSLDSKEEPPQQDSLWEDNCEASGSSTNGSYAQALKIPTDIDKNTDSNAKDNDEEWEDCSELLEKPKSPESALPKAEPIPEFILDVLRKDAGDMGCDSDALIAQMMQSQYDHEYNEEVKRIEKKRNRDSKVSISLDNYMRDGDLEFLTEEEQYEVGEKRDWDRFETNEKLFETIPKWGFKIGEDGEKITKHDDNICSVRNACRVMSFPPEFPTGDAAAFDMKLSNQVFNQLRTYSSKKNKKSKMQDRKENVATAEMGVDAPTRLLLYKLINNQILEQVNGIVSTGKEAVILHGSPDPNYVGDLILPKECAIKIFKTTLNEFKQRDRYIKDDYRFKDRFSKQNNRVIINMWAEKEMHNMMRMRDAGINCPDVVTLKKHVLVMSFIGDNHNAAPKLKDARLSEAELSLAYEEIIEMMHRLHNVAKLVHADLSEYNILWHDGKCWFIDVAQSVEPEHPSALEFLMRDCGNIVTFFKKRGLPNVYTREKLFEYITSLDAAKHNAAMLERIHTRGASIKEATAPNQEEVPDEFKPLAYPFETAWEKSLEDKRLAKEVEVTDALKVLSVKDGGEEIYVAADSKI